MHIWQEDLELYVRGKVGTKRASAIQTHILECGTCDEKLCETRLAYQQLTSFSNRPRARTSERRCEVRIPSDEVATVRPLLPGATPVAARIVNTSVRGFRLHVSQPFLPGSLVQVRFKQTIAMAEVRYCGAAGDGFQVGLELEDVIVIAPRQPS